MLLFLLVSLAANLRVPASRPTRVSVISYKVQWMDFHNSRCMFIAPCDLNGGRIKSRGSWHGSGQGKQASLREDGFYLPALYRQPRLAAPSLAERATRYF